MKRYIGVIVDESLTDTGLLADVKILKTEVEPVTAEHQTPHLQRWTLRTVEVAASAIDRVAEKVSRSLDTKNGHWYADFKNYRFHYVVFPSRIFKVDRQNPAEYEAVKHYGLGLGIPKQQLDFSGE